MKRRSDDVGCCDAKIDRDVERTAAFVCYTCPHSAPSGRQVCSLTGQPIVRLTCSGEPVAAAAAICPESRGPDRKGRVEWPVGSGLIWYGLPMPLRLLVCTKIGRWLLGLPKRAPGVLPMCGCYRPLKVMWMASRRRLSPRWGLRVSKAGTVG